MRALLLLLTFGLPFCTHGQDYPRKDINLEKLADEIFPLQELDLNYEDFYENLAQLLSNPLDLNRASREELRSLFVLSEEHINSLLKYREDNGKLLSVYELQAVPGWDRAVFNLVIPFVTVRDAQTELNKSIFQRIASEKNNYLMIRYSRSLESQKGYTQGSDSAQQYLGSPDKLYLRYRVARSGDFSIGFTAEKDPGEQIIWSPTQKQYGFDFTSLHIALQNKGPVKNLVLGDFQCQFGQGLILGGVFGFGKNSETVTTTRRSNLGFLPYTAVNETLFFRGAAASVSVSKNLLMHAFVSRIFKDGNTIQSSDDEGAVSAFQVSGLHRTPGEIASRQQTGETDAGLVLQFKTQALDAGIIVHQATFDQPLMPASRPYNQFIFRGSQNQNVGAYLNYSFANFTFFSEFAQTLGHGNAFTAGLLGNLGDHLEVSLLFRSFSPDFYSFTSNAFSENTLPQNEKGLYWGWKYTLNKKWSASGFGDLFSFPWLRYRAYAPSEGYEWLMRLNYSPTRAIHLFAQAREECKVRNVADPGPSYATAFGTKRNFWLNCAYESQPFSFRARAQFSSYQLSGPTTTGFALVQDVSVAFRRWSIAARYALFDTDDYDNRIYIYERDVWLAYSFPALYGVGVRTYAVVQYKLTRSIDIWLRWAQIRYTNRDTIGSGLDTVASSTGNDVKFQVRIQF